MQGCGIVILKSRLIFEVCGSMHVLEERECAVKLTMDGDINQ